MVSILLFHIRIWQHWFLRLKRRGVVYHWLGTFLPPPLPVPKHQFLSPTPSHLPQLPPLNGEPITGGSGEWGGGG